MSWRTLWPFAAFQCVWLACATGAADGRSAPGLIGAGLIIAARVASPGWRSALIVVLVSGATGVVAESLLCAAGLVRYAAAWPAPHLAPAWVVGLWMAFGSMLGPTARLLQPRPLLKAFMLGAIFGPLSYVAGERLGALVVAEPSWLAYAAISLVWSVSFPALVAAELWLADRQPA